MHSQTQMTGLPSGRHLLDQLGLSEIAGYRASGHCQGASLAETPHSHRSDDIPAPALLEGNRNSKRHALMITNARIHLKCVVATRNAVRSLQ
jgi:hypothetical protein